MKRLLRKFKRSSKVARIIYILLSVGYLVSYIFFAKSVINLTGIETILRYIILVLLLAYFVFYLYKCLCKLVRRRYKLFSFLSVITFLLIVIFSIGAYSIDWLIGKLGDFGEKDTITYTSYLITLNDTTLNAKSTLGMIDDNEDIEGNILAKKIINEHDLKYKVDMYDDESGTAYYDMLYDLYDKKVDGIFVSSNYVTLFSSEDDFMNIAEQTKVVYQKSAEYKNEDKKLETNDKSLTEPFTVLIMGVDSEFDGLNANAAFNGDTLILATFNPDTLNATLFSLPRDIYVPIACRGNVEAKINSSAASGTACVINTIQNLTDIEIDYYAKINFKGVVDLVDAVGGITVDVEEPDYLINHGNPCGGKVCEQDSDRRWGEYTIYIDPGVQNLNGEEALAYARCRGLYVESDLARNRHQQDVILALAQKMIQIKNLDEFKSILNAVSNNVATNMSTDQILSSYKILKNMISNVISDNDFINIEKTKLQVYSLPVYIERTGTTTSALGYYENSLDDIIHAMKVNLGEEEPVIEKSMKYSLNEEYEARVAGEGITGGASNSTFDNYIGKTKASAESYCSSRNISCKFTYIDENNTHFDSTLDPDTIAYQDPHPGILMKDVGTATFYVIGATKKKEDKPVKEEKVVEEEKDEEIPVEEDNSSSETEEE